MAPGSLWLPGLVERHRLGPCPESKLPRTKLRGGLPAGRPPRRRARAARQTARSRSPPHLLNCVKAAPAAGTWRAASLLGSPSVPLRFRGDAYLHVSLVHSAPASSGFPRPPAGGEGGARPALGARRRGCGGCGPGSCSPGGAERGRGERGAGGSRRPPLPQRRSCSRRLYNSLPLRRTLSRLLPGCLMSLAPSAPLPLLPA